MRWPTMKSRKVAIAAPAHLHFALAAAAIKAGKDVYVEKPLCLDEKEGRAAYRTGRGWQSDSNGRSLASVPYMCREAYFDGEGR